MIANANWSRTRTRSARCKYASYCPNLASSHVDVHCLITSPRFVCAGSAHDSDGFQAPVSKHARTIFRTYTDGVGPAHSARQDSNDGCTVLEAARATMGTACLISSKLSRRDSLDSEATFVNSDQRVKFDNPLGMLFEEVYRVFPNEYVACVISIGAGQLKSTSSCAVN